MFTFSQALRNPETFNVMRKFRSLTKSAHTCICKNEKVALVALIILNNVSYIIFHKIQALQYPTLMTRVVRKSPSLGLKNRVIWPYLQLSQLVELSRYACMFGVNTLNRKTLTPFVRTKPRGSVVITKPLALRIPLCYRKASWLYYMALYH